MSSPQCIVTENEALYEVWQCAIDFCLWPIYFFDKSDFWWYVLIHDPELWLWDDRQLAFINHSVLLNLCHTELVLRNMKYISIFYYSLTLRRHRSLDSFLMEDEDLC